MKKYLKLIRVKHYIKNLLIFLPVIFSGKISETELLENSFWGFLAFCFISSAIYIINDIKDAPKDKHHPTKCKRPIASGAVSVKSAIITAILVFCLAVIFGSISHGANIGAWVCIALYFVLNIAYSMGLKNMPIVDIAILVSGFLLRVLYGAAVTGIAISSWLYLTVISGSFYLGLGKRRNEISQLPEGSTRKVLEAYNYSFLDKNMYMSMALAIVFYSLWTVDSVTISRTGSDKLIWTVPLVILICLKYSLTVEGNSDGDPVEVILKDTLLLALIVIFCIVIMALIYSGGGMF